MMLEIDFIRSWNGCCINPACQIPPAALYDHNTGAVWGGGKITKLHFYRTIAEAATNHTADRTISIPVINFFVPRQTIQLSRGNPNVTSVYRYAPKRSTTCFTPRLKVYVS